MTRTSLAIGVLALQGAFAEHATVLRKIRLNGTSIAVTLVRTPEDLSICDALVIPGGESTTLTTLIRSSSLLETLSEFIKSKPVWGTCAGAILLSQVIEGGKAIRGGDGSHVQPGLFGEAAIPVRTRRNGWGSQVESFSGPLTVHVGGFKDSLKDQAKGFEGVFIRAPVVVEVLDTSVEPVATIDSDILPPLGQEDSQAHIVALRWKNLFYTTFHPELTSDHRMHNWWVTECVLKTLD